jgi:filamentous hemagglutinin
MQTGAKNFIQAYNPEHGIIGDLLECAWDKTVGAVVPTGNARDLSNFFNEAEDAGLDLNVASHSQGSLLAWRALQNSSLSKNWNFQFFGSPVQANDLLDALKKAKGENKGLYINKSKEPIFFGLAKRNDSVGTILGHNAANFGEFIDGVASAATLLGAKSDHSNYLCQGSFCANEQPAIQNFRTKITQPEKINP